MMHHLGHNISKINRLVVEYKAPNMDFAATAKLQIPKCLGLHHSCCTISEFLLLNVVSVCVLYISQGAIY